MAKKTARKTRPKVKASKPKRMSKGVKHPWEVWHLDTGSWTYRPDKFHTCYDEFKTRKEAEACIKKTPDLIAPVIRHIDIPAMEY